MAESSFEEIVNIIWDIKNPEAQISKLMAQLTKLETKLDTVAQKAANIKLSGVDGGGGGGGISGVQPAAGYSARVTYVSDATGRIVSKAEGTGFSNVSRSGATPSGIGAQYIPEGVRRRYTFENTDTEYDWQVKAAQDRRRRELQEEQRWQGTMSRLIGRGETPGSYGYEDAYARHLQHNKPNSGTGIVPFGHDFSNSPASTKQVFEDLKNFNTRASQELAYYKSMWDAVSGTNPMALSVIGPQGQFRSGANRYSGQGQVPLPSVPWFTGAGSMAPGAATWIGPYTGAGAGYGPTAPGTGPFMGGLGGGYGGAGGGYGGYVPPSYGPYTYRGFADEYRSWAQRRAQGQWDIGDYPGFESTMQGPGNRSRWEYMRRNATVSQFEAEFDMNQVAGLQGGARGGYAQHEYLGYKINDLNAQYQKARLSGNAAEVDRLGKAVKSAQDEYDNFGNTLSIFDNKFMRHIAWIAQGIMIWGALRVASDAVRILVTELNNLEAVQSRVGFINGMSAGGVAVQSALGAQYGLTPTQSGAGTLVGAQLGTSGADMQNARQLALVFGADQYSNALRELYQTEMRANAVGVEHVAVMDYIATAYKTAPGTLESYFDSLQQGILLSHDLGVEAEAAGLSILKMAEATEDSPEKIAVTIQSVIGMLRKGAVQDKLGGYGITTGTPGDMLRQVAAQVTSLVASGELDRAKALIDEVTGSLNAPQRQLQLLTDFQELNNLFTNTNTELSTMDELLNNIGDTGQSTWDRLTAGVLAYADSLIAAAKAESGLMTGKNRTPEEIIQDQENPLITILRFIANPGQRLAEGYNTTKEYFDAVGRQAIDEANRNNYKTETGLDSRYSYGPYKLQDNGTVRQDQFDDPRYLDWLNRQSGNPDYASEGSRFSYRPPGTGVGGTAPGTPIGPALPPSYDFGGFQTFEKGWDWDKFKKDVSTHEGLLAGVPGYDIDRKQIAFWDEASQSYKMMIADLNAIRWATDEQRKLMQSQIQGTFNVPAGGSVLIDYYALTQGFGPNVVNGKSASAGGGGGTAGGGGGSSSYGSVFNKLKNGVDQFGIPNKARGTFGDTDWGSEFSKSDPIDFFGIPDEARQAGKDRKGMSRMRKPGIGDSDNRSATGSQSRQLQNVVINNTIRVYIDGRVVAAQTQRQNYRQFENVRNSAFTSPSSQVAI